MIKMSDVYEIDADFENMKIFFIGEKNILLGSIEFLSPGIFKEQHDKSIKIFMDSLQGKKINIHLPPPPNILPTKKSYGKGSLFMDFSSGEKL